jgi:hypothetical protein
VHVGAEVLSSDIDRELGAEIFAEENPVGWGVAVLLEYAAPILFGVFRCCPVRLRVVPDVFPQ